MFDFFELAPEIFLISATISILVFSTSKRDNKAPLVRNVAWLGLLSIFITIILIATKPITTANLCYNTLIIDNFTYYCKIALLLSTASTILMSLQYFKQETVNTFESIVLILLSTCSMLFMISAYDLIAIYLAIELQSLCFYVIAASKRTSEFSTEAGLKYFVLGAFSSGILLFGCSMIYGFTGVTNLEELAKIFTGVEAGRLDITVNPSWILVGDEQPIGSAGSMVSSYSVISDAASRLGILFVAVGFLFKLTAVPFHMWAPDVYEGSPTYVTAFFSIAPKIAIFANMLRVFIYSFYDPTWQQLFVLCSIASMTLGAIAGLAQNKVKRLLAYSSIGHVGYLLIGLACGTVEGIQSLLIGILIYVFMTINAFAVVLALRQNRQAPLKYISDFSGLAKTNPILAVTLSITMFSYAGIPPLAGFCSKFYLFFAALGCGAYLLALVGIITSVISCFYYIRFVKVMYFDTKISASPFTSSGSSTRPSSKKLALAGASPLEGYRPFNRGSFAASRRITDREKSLLLAITFCFITFFFLYPSPFFLVTHQMALSLCL
jgi:NADH:ubiquinone oxidoreductase subunit 2 (subunit N)